MSFVLRGCISVFSNISGRPHGDVVIGNATAGPSHPPGRAFAEAALLFGVFAAMAVPLGLGTGVLTLAPRAEGLWITLPLAFFLPALVEELVFRGPLLRWRHPGVAAGTLLAYVAWHGVEGATFLRSRADIFHDPVFLLIAGLFGVVATLSVRRSGRLLPAIVMHWVMVVCWQHLFGGPTLAAGDLL